MFTQTLSHDEVLESVCAEIQRLDPEGLRSARVLRDTFDQLYDGQHTGRYRWDQLYKMERMGCGPLVEINLHREFNFRDGAILDYQIAGVDVDCKYSQAPNEWMIRPEAQMRLCLLVWSDDQKSKWSMGIVHIRADRLNEGGNRDQKATLNTVGRSAITWIFRQRELPPNVLLQLDRSTVDEIMSLRSGRKRLNALFRKTLGMRVGRAVVATVAQQDNYMKHVRGNRSVRTALQPEGIVILGQYGSHRAIARALDALEPGPGESISLRVTPAKFRGEHAAEIDGGLWRIATEGDPVVCAPKLPRV